MTYKFCPRSLHTCYQKALCEWSVSMICQGEKIYGLVKDSIYQSAMTLTLHWETWLRSMHILYPKALFDKVWARLDEREENMPQTSDVRWTNRQTNGQTVHYKVTHCPQSKRHLNYEWHSRSNLMTKKMCTIMYQQSSLCSNILSILKQLI